jgi:hypothetical protein
MHAAVWAFRISCRPWVNRLFHSDQFHDGLVAE